MALYWPTPGFKGRKFKLCVLTRWGFNFCVRSSPLRGLECNASPAASGKTKKTVGVRLAVNQFTFEKSKNVLIYDAGPSHQERDYVCCVSRLAKRSCLRNVWKKKKCFRSSILSPQWGAADAGMKVPSDNTGFSLAWSRSVYDLKHTWWSDRACERMVSFHGQSVWLNLFKP